ncbi:DUF2931 family protein [Pedobacter duraquae]|uniref:DUF2931 family protein n=1 Tax=Pedobacter duraquae TaxID=425511 RepID=A0A4R6IHN2_9SPHI|nr:DUF2931 family protein [Pedobacter duraquae]TDO20715.1 Protein of unknown function (DUF2931) [Pedobacter duraquae]
MNLHRNICFLFVLLLITVAGCKNKGKAQKMNEKFNWTGTVSAPEEYPMEVYDGAIIADDFTFRFDEMWGTQNTGWGETGGVFSIDREQMDAPDSLKFTWMSLVEKKFYTGSWKLDKDKIAKLFREGYVNDLTHQKGTYNMIKVGLAPKGLVVVWLSGVGFQTEVGSYQAVDTVIKKEDAYENAKYMFDDDFIPRILADKNIMKPEIKAKIASQGYPEPNVYQVYRERFNWRPEIHLPKGGKEAVLVYQYFNGEIETRFGDELVENQYMSRAAPKSITLIWKDKAGNKNAVGVEPFNEKEIINAFKQLGNTSKIDMVITVNESNSAAAIVLKDEHDSIKIVSGKIEISENLTN